MSLKRVYEKKKKKTNNWILNWSRLFFNFLFFNFNLKKKKKQLILSRKFCHGKHLKIFENLKFNRKHFFISIVCHNCLFLKNKFNVRMWVTVLSWTTTYFSVFLPCAMERDLLEVGGETRSGNHAKEFSKVKNLFDRKELGKMRCSSISCWHLTFGAFCIFSKPVASIVNPKPHPPTRHWLYFKSESN